MFNKDKNSTENKNLDDIVSSKLGKLIKAVETQESELHKKIIEEINNIYMPVFNSFFKNLRKYNIDSDVEKDNDDISESITLNLDDGSIWLYGYFKYKDHNNQKVEKPIIISSDFGNYDDFNIGEINEEILLGVLLKNFESYKKR